MNRKETTRFLSELLVQRKLLGKYYASEVTLDCGAGKGKEKRVDFIQFVPKNQRRTSHACPKTRYRYRARVL